MEELKVLTEQQIGVIRIDNLAELKERLSGYLEDYRHAAYTEETKGFAKKAVADLRRLRKETNDAKIAAKKEYMKPCDEFEAQVKELLALIDEPIALIDKQIKEFEAVRKEERQNLIKSLYEEIVAASAYAEYMPLDKIYSAKWENASTTEKHIREAMSEQVEGVTMEVESIRTMIDDPEAQAYALHQYKVGCTVVEAMGRAKEYLDMQARRAAREEEERKLAAKREAEKEAMAKIEDAFLSIVLPDDEEPFEVEPQPLWSDPIRVTYTIQAQRHQIDMLEAFMTAHEIEIVRREPL